MMTSLVDSHAHLDMEEFDEDRSQVVERAFEQGIKAILCPAEVTHAQSVPKILDLIEKYQSLIAAAGVHPHQAKSFSPECTRRIKELAEAKKIKAIGEIGLDFHYNLSTPAEQEDAFRHQLNLAQELGLPVVVHSRNSGKKLVQAVEEEHFSQGGVLHCFTEDWEVAKQMMNRNFFISFSGILTFSKAPLLREVAKKIPLEKLLVETDSPYLVPVPFRGLKKRNEPAYVVEVAKVLAEIKDIALEELSEVTSRNFEFLFSFEIKNLR
jgi:TatD DNase family protein